MIHVRIVRNHANGWIHAFTISGHANFADSGQDIVCAGISAITVGTVNAVEDLLGIELKSCMENGFLQAELPDTIDQTKSEKLQLLLESMVVMLKTIEASYGAYIKINH